ncbi:MAG: right-handed parallel beta-helix repeat-containing protein, partial [Thermoplasmata archaeon]|nr:right-handed parallel beta-helix repeat-containing protein [Thermoplasmata archaeon]
MRMEKVVSTLVCFGFLITMLAAVVPGNVAAVTTWIVDDDGTIGVDCHFNTINAAMGVAIDGDTIQELPGAYSESVPMTKTVSLVGSGSELTTIDGGSDPAIMLKANYTSIDGFTMVSTYPYALSQHYFWPGYYAPVGVSVENCAIHGVSAMTAEDLYLGGNTFTGTVYLSGTTSSVLESNVFDQTRLFIRGRDNVLSNNVFNGDGSRYSQAISLNGAINTTLVGNTIDNYHTSLYFFNARQITMTRTTITNTTYGLDIWGDYDHIIDGTNTIDGRPMFYKHGYELPPGSTIPADQSVYGLIGCSGLTIDGITPGPTSFGLLIAHSNNIVVQNSVFTDHKYGLRLVGSEDCAINSNSFTGNYRALQVYGGQNNMIEANTFTDDTWGIETGSRTELLTIKGNTFNTRDYGVFTWHLNNSHITQNTFEDPSDGIFFRSYTTYVTVDHNTFASTAGYGAAVEVGAHGEWPSCNYNTIDHNTFIDCPSSVRMQSGNYNQITNNVMTGGEIGVLIMRGNYNYIAGNTITEIDLLGIYIDSNPSYYQTSIGNTIADNIVSDAYYGIATSNQQYMTVSNNTMTNCGGGFWMGTSGHLYTVSEAHFWNEVDTLNTIDGRPTYYLKNQTGGTTPQDAGWVGLYGCDGVTVTGYNDVNVLNAIMMAFSQNCVIRDNQLGAPQFALGMYDADNNIITNNTILNVRFGPDLTGCDNNLFTYNTLVRGESILPGDGALSLWNSSDNTFHHNYFIGFDNWITERWPYTMPAGSNIWYDATTNEGNYWKGPTSGAGITYFDTDGDGIGDSGAVPFPSAGHDQYPLMDAPPIAIANIAPAGEGIKLVNVDFSINAHYVSCAIMENGEELVFLEDDDATQFVYFEG